jgi:hypothetical protein
MNLLAKRDTTIIYIKHNLRELKHKKIFSYVKLFDRIKEKGDFYGKKEKSK